MLLLYISDADSGGIAEYAIRQVAALAEAGLEVTFLCRPSFPVERLRGCRVNACLPKSPEGGPRWKKIADRIGDGRRIAKMVADAALSQRVDAVLMACYAEYFSPFWAPVYRRLAARGIPIGTIAHDPVRDFVLGPRWWHRWSVRLAYSFVRDVFVHDDTPVDFGGAQPAGTRVHRVPHGPYELAAEKVGRECMRERYGLSPDDHVFLSFGQIRDGKNLDRFLRAMPDLPGDVKLLVAGCADSLSQRTPSHYRELANELGVADRCVWDIRYIPDEETGDLFAAADFILMIYSAKFRSASGVMNTAVSARKPILASSGPGPFQSAIQDYDLGIFLPPDDDFSVINGALKILDFESRNADWESYEKGHSWVENARRVTAALGA